MRVSVVILPVFRWEQARSVWARADELGFHGAYTYDHLSWRDFRDGPWFGAVPTLAAAATVTSRIRLGTLVTSANFRHPVTLAKDLMTLDDMSGGRMTVGIGAGTTGFDASVLGLPALSAPGRASRFEEFVRLLDVLLREPMTTWSGEYFAAHEAAMHPGSVQRPRVPFAIAAKGPRGTGLVARYADAWVTTGRGEVSPEESAAAVRDGLARARAACEQVGRDPADLRAVFLSGFTSDRPLSSYDTFLDVAHRYAAAGVTELVLHWPLPDTVFAADVSVLERVAEAGIPAVSRW